MAQASLKIVSIAVSPGCEMTRWLLERAAIPFEENFHAPLLHVLATKGAHGGTEAPVMITGDSVLGDLRVIMDDIDNTSPTGLRVYGETDVERGANERLLGAFLDKAGEAVRQMVYNRVLPHREVMLPLATYRVPGWEALVITVFYPIWRRLLAKALGLTPQNIARAPGLIWEGFDIIEAELETRGTPFLAGAAPGGVDIVVAAMLAPVVLPPEYGGVLPRLEQLTPDLQAFVRQAVARPAGELALRVYRQARQAPAGAGDGARQRAAVQGVG